MTVIAFDGKTLAADKLSLRDGRMFAIKKIRRIYAFFHRVNKSDPIPLLVGYSGKNSTAQEFFEWAEKGFPKDEIPPSIIADNAGDGMVITPDKRIWIFDASATPYEIDDTKHAIGYGAESALVVMNLGYNAITTVKAVSAILATCGLGMDTLTFDEEEQQ